MELARFQNPTVHLHGVIQALWHGNARALYLADDLLISDPDQGRMTLRRFDQFRQQLWSAFPSIQVTVANAATDATPDGYSGIALLRFQAIHSRPGPYGAPSHKTLSWSALAQIEATTELATEITLIRDNAALLGQTDQDIAHWAKQRPSPHGGHDPAGDRFDGSPWSTGFADILTTMMDGDFSVLHRSYDPAAELCYPGQTTQTGPQRAECFWLALRAALPAAQFKVHNAIGQEDPLNSPYAAFVWSLTGLHEGWGRFGAPTGKRLSVLGASFVTFGPRGVRREHTVLDDLSVIRQFAQNTPVS